MFPGFLQYLLQEDFQPPKKGKQIKIPGFKRKMVDGGRLTLVGSNQQLLLSAMFTSKYQVSNIHECNIHHINVYIYIIV